MLMHSSIVSRFRGALLGAALGESLGAHCQAQHDPDQRWEAPERSRFHPLAPTVSRSMPDVINQLLGSWSENRAAGALATDDPADLILLLPAALLRFDQLQSVSEHDAFKGSRFSPSAVSLDERLMHQAIALILRGCLPHQLIEQLVGVWQGETHTDAPQVINQLWQVQTIIESGQGLAVTSQFFDNSAQPQSDPQASGPLTSLLMPLALYGFLCTPEDGRLALLRTARFDHQPQITCALTGALVGAWAGVSAMPMTWRHAIDLPQRSSALSSLWQISSEVALFQLADQLAAAWAGVYHPIGDRAVTNSFSGLTSLPRDRQIFTSPGG